MFQFTYTLQDSGWADGSISNGSISIHVVASYLNDPLGELATAALTLSEGEGSAVVIFMNEPGEHQLILRRTTNQIFYEVRWFDDWASWGMYPSDQFETLLTGQSHINEFLDQIQSVLASILQIHGLDGYRAKWIEHDFPIEAFNTLVQSRAT